MSSPKIIFLGFSSYCTKAIKLSKKIANAGFLENSARLRSERTANAPLRKNEGFLPRSVLDVVSRIASPLIIAVVVGEGVHHHIEWGFGHTLKTGRADEDSAFRPHVAGGDPKVLVFIVEFTCGGFIDSFHRFYSPFLLCLYYSTKKACCQVPFSSLSKSFLYSARVFSSSAMRAITLSFSVVVYSFFSTSLAWVLM